ncbi:cation diffusion facilitator family transporter [Gloeocapsopsis sp. IPPAS B-1203]|uniref:cation diffusion facilitator family transporter n=1 Tax=Gloeocapsopsis sp. IPPAS B-1203 TaxID=2049454 RepID=UPI000C1856D4|nr:cation diffusion facilitator family transporter [Gloeocapsopsis sp. IPPAS B-1203]PIG91774.1 cation transporter permease [Gloeocapsopsis sp. IPPAS B-1203]
MSKLHSNTRKIQILQLAIGLEISFFAVELGVGLWVHSLSLLADAGHLLSDVAALGVTLIASWMAQSAKRHAKYGNGRIELFAALLNSLSLIILASWVATEAIARMQSPTSDILSLPMLLTAVVGLGINGCNAFWLHECSHCDLNFKAAFLHVLSDLFSSFGVILAAIAISWLGWMWADSAISLLVSGLVAISATALLLQSIWMLFGTSPTTNACDCEKRDMEKLLFPSLEEILR